MENRLLAATERLLEQGHRFAALTIEQMTREAGVSRAAFYLHFKDKGELVSRLMQHITDEIIESTGTWLSDAESARWEDLQNALVAAARTFKKHHAILTAVQETAPRDQNVERLYQALIERAAMGTKRSFSTLRRRGLSRPGANNAVAVAMSGMMIAYLIQNVGKCNDAEVRSLGKALGYIAASAAFADQPG